MNISELIVSDEVQMPSFVSFDSITASGNIGIGTSSPSTTMDIRGDLHIGTSGDSNYIAFYGTTYDGEGSWNHTYIGERKYESTESSELLLWKGNDAGGSAGADRIRYCASGGHLFQTTGTATGSFETVATNGEAVDRMIITNTGNVGIGNSNPSYTLDVSGDFRCARFFTADYGYWKRIYVAGDYNAGQARLYFINISNLNTYLYATGFTSFSDDRLKEEEEYVTNGLEICNKLSPQIYLKKNTLTSTDRTLWKRESGFIAQEIYYNVPELRHIVSYGQGIEPEEDIISSSQPNVDPDYSSWGDDIAAINYTEIIPYTVSAIQELSKNQTEDKKRITELETENEALQSEIALLKQQMATVMQKLGL